MRNLDQSIISDAIEFASRWGFLTKRIFIEFLCNKSGAQTFRYWRRLVSDGYFVASSSSNDILQLSVRSRRQHQGTQLRPSRSPIYVEHDSSVARLFFAVERIGAVKNYWLEDDLLRDSVEAYDLLGGNRLDRLPDLILELLTQSGLRRFAVEVEKTLKTRARYDRIALAYQSYSKLDGVLFVCASPTIEAAVNRAFNETQFEKQKFGLGITSIGAVESRAAWADVRVREQNKSLVEFFDLNENVKSLKTGPQKRAA